MAKKINKEQIVDSLEQIGEFELPKGSCARDIAKVRRMLQERDSLLSPGRNRIWRAIMTSRWTRYGSAAAIAVAAVVGMVLLDGTKLSAEELLTEVSRNMSKLAWVKVVSSTYKPGEDEPVSTDTALTDLRNRQVFLIYDAGYLHQRDYNKMRWSIYRPEDNTMIVKKLTGEWMGPETQVEQFIEKLQNEGLEVRESTETVNGVEMRVIEYDETLNNLSQVPNSFMSKMSMGGTPVKTIRTRLGINEQRLWLNSGEIRYFDAADELIVTIKSAFSGLPETGPADIYELGAPRDAKVDNKVPIADVEEIRGKIQDHRKRFLKNYVAIQIEARVENGTEQPSEAMVIYSRQNKLRVDVFSSLYSNSTDLNEQRKYLLKGSLDRLEPLWSGSRTATVRSVRIYDGLWQHILDKREGGLILRKPQRRPDGDTYGDDDLDDFGWRTLWWLNEPEHMYADEFSSDNGLIAMELTSQWTGQRLPKRQVLYVDPNKDYVYRRYSNEELLDGPWQIEKIDPNDIEKNKSRLREETRVFDVTEYGQTSTGRWYPRTIEITGFDRTVGPKGYRNEYNRVSRIYLLEEDPDLPDSLFDPEALK